VEAFSSGRNDFGVKFWKDIKMGELVKIHKNEQIPADVFLLKSSNKSGMCYVETVNLDGESSLKEKYVPKKYQSIEDTMFIEGDITCDPPDANIEKFHC
jgi:P-type E1-E2 ATPase